ncbi:helix-turn-helix domain-containing protein [Paenibacillus sp. GCM10012303]|uniref:helix-turn-helix domain-containing protein n=1 Tax=Paenibacillus sp. GCM10012303 TaxID=3317340 RepID=UPI00360B42C9
MHFSRGKCLLQYWLDKKGMTQAELSRKTGWSSRMISYWCSRKRLMTPEAMYTVARLLEINTDDLYQWILEVD